MNHLLVNGFCLSMFGNNGNSPDQPSTVTTNFHTLVVTLQLNSFHNEGIHRIPRLFGWCHKVFLMVTGTV